MNKLTHLAVVALAAASGLAATSAEAATSARSYAQNPTGVCQSALPAFDGLIRKRPKAIQNEGTAPAFVTCSYTSQGVDFATGTDIRNPVAVRIYFISADAVPLTVSCTAVLGWAGQTLAQSVKTVNVTSAGSNASILWQGPDFATGATVIPSALFNVSCNLPPGAGIADSYLTFNEEIGS